VNNRLTREQHSRARRRTNAHTSLIGRVEPETTACALFQIFPKKSGNSSTCVTWHSLRERRTHRMCHGIESITIKCSYTDIPSLIQFKVSIKQSIFYFSSHTLWKLFKKEATYRYIDGLDERLLRGNYASVNPDGKYRGSSIPEN